jgi:hypothetical protein
VDCYITICDQTLYFLFPSQAIKGLEILQISTYKEDATFISTARTTILEPVKQFLMHVKEIVTPDFSERVFNNEEWYNSMWARGGNKATTNTAKATVQPSPLSLPISATIAQKPSATTPKHATVNLRKLAEAKTKTNSGHLNPHLGTNTKGLVLSATTSATASATTAAAAATETDQETNVQDSDGQDTDQTPSEPLKKIVTMPFVPLTS